MSERANSFLKLFILVALLLVRAPLQAEELQDPTRPSYVNAAGTPDEPKAAPSLVLNAIRIASGKRSAMINNRTVKVGGQAGDARVVAINRTSVQLQRGTEQFTLYLLPNKVKQAHKAARR